jgi:hypothetical protein
MQAALAFSRHAVRAVRNAATDTRIPKPLRWLAALGLLPIPGPFDEALLLLVVVPLALFYRRPLADAWTRSVDADRAGGLTPTGMIPEDWPRRANCHPRPSGSIEPASIVHAASSSRTTE